jgi:hypothetical protein
MNFLRTLQADLRERQIFPAVVVLAVLAVAIPVVASMTLSSYKTPVPTPIAPETVSLPKGIATPAHELLVLTTPPTVNANTRTGSEPDPFREGSTSSGVTAATSGSSSKPATTTPAKTTTTPAKTTPAKTTPTPARTTPAKTTAPKNTSSKTKSTTPKASKPSSGSTGKTAPPVQATPTTGPATLKSTQAYTVNIDTKDATGTHTLTDVVRLAPLPAAQTPEVIYLGVVKGGQKAAFLFTNAVKVSGPSSSDLTCLPDTADCQIVELRPGQGMSLTPTSNTALISTFTFELMSIGAENFSSSDAATEARTAVSTAGQTLLPLYNSTALQTLRFDANIGALVHHSVPAGGSGVSTGSTGSTAATGNTGATGASGSTGSGATNAERFPDGVTFVLAPLR